MWTNVRTSQAQVDPSEDAKPKGLPKGLPAGVTA